MIVETLRVYVAVVEQSNFSRAAELLNLSQPSVSQHIRNLENEFGVKLMHRSPHHVKTTEAGNILYTRAKHILSTYEAAKEEINLLRDEVSGSLKIGASFTIGEYILPHLLAEFVLQYPHVDIQAKIANTDEISQGVRSNTLDIGLVEGNVESSEILETPPFMEDEMVLVSPPNHPLALHKIVEAAALQDQIWVFREPGSGTRAFSDQFIGELGLNLKRSFIFNSNQGVKEAVLAGLGLSLLSRWVIRNELQSGELLPLSVKGQRFVRYFSILRDPKSTSDTMAARMFIQKLRQFKM
ncbi:LysR substrate-binding domain-containing protein [Paenibacillus sp. GCM10027626]|uniref:LysR family transcriptional regulator n=1 Tax=Paenibacillus sp. GCM10027626 TaxID=3273411 RepID=UPI0036267E23